MLFDSGAYKLARRQKLDFKEIEERAQKYFDDKFGRANQFLKGVGFYCKDGDCKMASFHLHQSAENFLRTIPMVFILYGHKSHDLSELMNAAKKHTTEIFKAFPRDTEEEKRLFDLLQRAYIESRYNPDFEITKEDIAALLPKVERLRDIVQTVCRNRIAYYAAQIEKRRWPRASHMIAPLSPVRLFRHFCYICDVRYWVAIILSLNCIRLSAAESWLPHIRNYNKTEYKAGTQNWMIFQDDNGWIYSANNDGLLQYDGHEWNLYPNGTLRALRKDGAGRLYVGAYNRFGYYEADSSGALIYRSLSDSVQKTVGNFNDIWDIYKIGHAVYFVSYHYIFKLQDDKISAIHSPERILASSLIGENLYVYREGRGIFLQSGALFIPLTGTEPLNDKNVIGILPYRTDGLVFITEYDGIYIFRDSGLHPYRTDIDSVLRTCQVYCAAGQRDKLYVGTIKNGLLTVDLSTGKTRRYDVSSGLQNNSVLSLEVTDQGNVWLGLDNGISYLGLNSPLSNLYMQSQNYGVGYASIVHDGRLYLGTNQGLFFTRWPIGEIYDLKLKPVAHVDGQVWALAEIGGTLFCGHNKGASIVEDGFARLVSGCDGFWNFRLAPDSDDRIVAGTYTGLVTLANRGSRSNPQWVFEKRIEGLDLSCMKVEYDRFDKNWWIVYGAGKCRVTTDRNLDKVENLMIYPDTTGRSEVSLFEDKGRVLFLSAQGVHRFDSSTRSFRLSDSWNRRLAEHGYLRVVETDRYGNVWYVCRGRLKRNYPSGAGYLTDSLGTRYLYDDLMNNYEHIHAVDENTAIISTLGGFSLYDAGAQGAVSDPDYDLAIRRIVFSTGAEETVLYKNDGFAPPGPRTVIASPYRKEGSYRFEMNPQNEAYSGMRYTVQLKGVNKHPVELDNSGIKEYTGLMEGVYEFTVTGTNRYTQETATRSVTLEILPPWYRSLAARLVYLLAFVGLLYGLFLLLKRYMQLQSHRQLLAQQREAYRVEFALKNEALAKEKMIVELRNETLEQNLKIKSQELANSMFNIIQKREIFISLRDELSKITQALKSANVDEALHKTNRLAGKIKQNIGEEDSWKKLEDNFNIVHHNFLTRLQERYPHLSSNDLKLAAYIRMNLLTKEIAPLLHVSERGLESARFRLRKKLGLPRNESLSKFMKNF